nr:hypothetical protein [Tanacetum cinerariifolium]
SVPAGVTRSVPAGVTRLVPAGVTRSVPAGATRSVPAGFTRSVPAGVTRSVPADSLDRNGAHVGYNCLAQVPSFQTLPSFRQQYPCCEDCGVLPEADHCQPPQYTVNQSIFNAHNDILNSQTMLMEQMTSLTSMCEMACQIIQKKQEEKWIKEEQAANARYWKIPACCDDDDDYHSEITPNEPIDSLSMGDEHLDTISATESDGFIKYSVENLVPNPSKPRVKTSFSDEDFPKEIYSNPLFDEEIIPMKIDPHPFNAESDLIESMLNHDSVIINSSKIDSLLDEFVGKLTILKSIPPGIDETDCHPKEETHFTKRLLYDNSSHHPPEEFVSHNSDADVESFTPFPIPVKDSDFIMEEINLYFNLDDQCRWALRTTAMTLKGKFSSLKLA